MPPDARVDDVRPGVLHALGKALDFFPVGAASHQVEHAQTIHDQKVLAHRFSHPRQNGLGKPAAPLKISAPLVGTKVGFCRQELVDQVPLGPHDFHAVVAGLSGKDSRVDKVTDRAFHATRSQRPRLETSNGCLQCTRRHTKRGVGIATGMQNLHDDFAAFGMYGLGDHSVV